MEPLILVNREHPHISIITLNRPSKRNALSIELMQQLCDALHDTLQRADQRVVIIQGAGPSFCAGMDLMEASQHELEEESSNLISKSLSLLHFYPLVTIAAVQGSALGGGAGLMSACDFVIAEKNTIIGYPEIRRGLVPAQIMPILSRQMRQRDLKEVVLLGEPITVEKAQQIGLVNRMTTMDKLLSDALDYARQFLKGAPNATIETKRLIDAVYPSDFVEDLKQGVLYHHKARTSSEAKEGINAFLEKRAPSWEK